MIRNSVSTATIIVLAVVLGAGCNGWRGFGFRATGPEMRRLRQELAFKPGMSVADVGAGRGELTVALAAELGPSGRVYATDIDPEALEQIRARVAAAELPNVTILPARGREPACPPVAVTPRSCAACITTSATRPRRTSTSRAPCGRAGCSPLSTSRRCSPGCARVRRRTRREIALATAWQPASWSRRSPPAASRS